MPVMEHLRQLYLVDRQVRGLRNRLTSAERYLTAQRTQRDAVQHRLEELETRKKQHQAHSGNLETEGASLDEQLEKFREDLNSAVTNKQYTAVLTELNTVKDMRSKIDDSILEEMSAVEDLEKEIIEVTAQLAERGKICDGAQAQLKERKNDVGDRLAELEHSREEAADRVPGQVLAVFETLSDTYDGEAIAEIEEVDRKRREYACGACNIQLPFEKIAMLTCSVKDVVRCPACGRILVLQEETRGALTK